MIMEICDKLFNNSKFKDYLSIELLNNINQHDTISLNLIAKALLSDTNVTESKEVDFIAEKILGRIKEEILNYTMIEKEKFWSKK